MKVAIICVATVDGRITPGLIGSRLDREHLEAARMRTDASLMGAQTLRRGDIEMRGPGGRVPEHRIRAILTRSGEIPLEDRKLFRLGPCPVVFTAEDRAPALAQVAGDRARVVSLPAGQHGLSVRAAVQELERMGAGSVLVEGGGRLNHAALAEGVVDEILVTIAPRLSGKHGDTSLVDGSGHLGNPFLELALLESRAAETGELFVRYGIKRNQV
jgi:riboflavin biosynthesis pyrimidine reductase